ncbi:uncharacterized protein LOC142710014 [Rhinoderma darwinii]|uniref:uncharacterized protein LOC142683472 n=1 Tax=Rhinoderma darwinii TaxID=43563 RepID=UPI003F66B616
MDSCRADKKQNNCRLRTSKYANVQTHRPKPHRNTPSTSKDIGQLYITGISILKLRDQSLENCISHKTSITQEVGVGNVTSAQTTGWKLKHSLVNDVPIICSYSRPLQINLNGHPLNAFNSRAEPLLHQCGRILAPADSESWWNYRFSTYTILSRNPERLCRPTHGIAGPEPSRHVQRQEMMTSNNQWNNVRIKPLLTDVSTQTQSLHDDHHTPDTEEGHRSKKKNAGGNLAKRMRKPCNDPPSRHVLSIPTSQEDPGSRIYTRENVPVMSPEPWPSPYTPEEEEISITVPLLPKLDNPGQEISSYRSQTIPQGGNVFPDDLRGGPSAPRHYDRHTL